MHWRAAWLPAAFRQRVPPELSLTVHHLFPPPVYDHGYEYLLCGYSDDPVMADFQDYGFSEVIAKPYRVVELITILQRVISKKGN